jgi:hypothetical protein
MNSDFLVKVADVLDAVADEKEKLASQLSSMQHEERARKIAPLAEKLSYINDDNLTEKLSSLDEKTLELISKVAGNDVPQLGYSVKTAGLNSSSASADSDFASWILS